MGENPSVPRPDGPEPGEVPGPAEREHAARLKRRREASAGEPDGGGTPPGSSGPNIKDRLTRRLTKGPAGREDADRTWKLTLQLVEAQDARRKAEDRLGKALAQLEQAGSRQGQEPDRSAIEAALRNDLERTRSGLQETERALAEARDRIDELEQQFRREGENRQGLETELAASRERLQQATALLKEIEQAYLAGRDRNKGPAPLPSGLLRSG